MDPKRSCSNGQNDSFHCLEPINSLNSPLNNPYNNPYNWVALTTCLISVVGIVGNVLVCLSVVLERRLHSATHYFLFSLAIADLLVCIFVMPFSILNELSGGLWPLTANWCIVYVSSDVFLCSVSIVHMTTISFDRYLGISRPLETRYTWNSTTSLTLKVAGVWLVTILISCPIAILAFIDVENVFRSGACQIFNRYFQIYGSIVCFFLPFAVNAFTYAKTVTKLKEQQETLNAQNGDCGLRRSTKTSSVRMKNQQSEESEDPDDSNLQPHLQPLMRIQQSIDSVECPTPPTDSHRDHDEQDHTKAMDKLRAGFKRTATALLGAKKLETVTNEQKAMKVLGIVFCSFFVCWFPFFSANVTLAFCGRSCSSKFPHVVGSIFLWLGYISSTLNPIIYTTFNQVYRHQFVKLITCHCKRERLKPHLVHQPLSLTSTTGTVEIRKEPNLP